MSKNNKPDKQEERDKRIGTAVNFINTPNLENVARSEIEKFLKKKGLNDQEITEAFEKAKKIKEEQKAKEEEKEKELLSKVQKLGVVSAPTEKFLNPQELIEIVEKAKISNLVSIRNRGVTTLYEQILGLNNLQTLIISNNKIQFIPSNIKNLQNLKIFHASCCNLQDHNIEDGFFELVSLQEINMSKNQLSLIDKFTKFIDLYLLDLSNNEIFQIPSDIENCKELRLLNLRDNHLTYLPISLKELKKLKKLYLDQNALNDPNNVLNQNNAEKILEDEHIFNN